MAQRKHDQKLVVIWAAAQQLPGTHKAAAGSALCDSFSPRRFFVRWTQQAPTNVVGRPMRAPSAGSIPRRVHHGPAIKVDQMRHI